MNIGTATAAGRKTSTSSAPMKKILILSCAATAIILSAGYLGWNIVGSPVKVRKEEGKGGLSEDSFPARTMFPALEPERRDSKAPAKKHDALEAISKDDANLAFAFSVRLMECKRVMGSLDAIEDVNSSGMVDPVTTLGMLESAEKVAEKCEGLTEEQLNLATELIEHAAEAGLLEAQLNYSTLLAQSILSPKSISNTESIERYKRKSIEFLDRAAQAGSRDALLQLGLAYQDGILVKPSLSQAYAYSYAYHLTGASKRSGHLLQQMEIGLSAVEASAAQEQGSAIYRRCCNVN